MNIWTRIFHPRVHDIEVNCCDLTSMIWYQQWPSGAIFHLKHIPLTSIALVNPIDSGQYVVKFKYHVYVGLNSTCIRSYSQCMNWGFAISRKFSVPGFIFCILLNFRCRTPNVLTCNGRLSKFNLKINAWISIARLQKWWTSKSESHPTLQDCQGVPRCHLNLSHNLFIFGTGINACDYWCTMT